MQPVSSSVEQRTVPIASVIIPHLNQVDMLARCLDSVLGQALAGPFEVIVVDNGSTVSLGAIKARFPQVIWAEERTPGPGPARNTGIAMARGAILAFIDADCRADPGWLATAVATVGEAPDRGAVAGNVLVDCIDFARMTGVEAYETVFAYRFKMYVEKKGFAGTGNLAMARGVQRKVGNFAGIGIAEDVDWGQRATAMGLTFTYQPEMRIWHPARPDFEALRVKWRRHIAHEFADHQARARPIWRWNARAAAIVVSVLPDSVRLLFAPRVGGLGNRGRGIAVLARIRWYRATEMQRVIGGSNDSTGATAWNRG